MPVLDFILNCLGLLLWLNWRSRALAAPGRSPGIVLISTLKRAAASPRDRWSSPLALVAMLFLRAIFYWQAGPTVAWLPRLSLGAIVLHFRNDVFPRMLLFSLLSFLLWLAAFYFSLLLVAGVSRPGRAVDPWMSLVRAHLGRAGRLPAGLMLLLPFISAFALWLVLGPVLGTARVLVPASSWRHLLGQSFVMGLGGWMLWQYAIVVCLGLHIVASYVYLGNAPFWSFVNATAGGLLRPLRWLPLRAGRVDLAPVLALILVVLVAIFGPGQLARLYARLPL